MSFCPSIYHLNNLPLLFIFIFIFYINMYIKINTIYIHPDNTDDEMHCHNAMARVAWVCALPVRAAE